MNLNIVTEREDQCWSLRRDAENLAAHTPGAVVSDQPDAGADINMFVNYALWEPVDTITTAMFTHLEFDGPLVGIFRKVAMEVDWCFAMCQHTLRELPGWKSSIMMVWPSPQFHRERLLQIGVCGRDYQSGRKRMHWVDEVEACPSVEVRTTGGELAWEDMPSYYDGLDYLLVISENEGGPKPVVEALARGVPVIAPDVGYAWDFPVIRYDGTLDGVLDTIRGLTIPEHGWESTAAHVAEVHERLLRWRS
jgi:hypothetical protein